MWIPYASDENDRAEIYLWSLHGVLPQRQQVSADGGVFAVWAPGSRNLYYRGTVPGAAAVAVWTAVIDDAARLRVSAPRLLFSNPGFQNAFDITPDGTRFVMTTVDSTPPRQQINLVLDSLGLSAQPPARD